MSVESVARRPRLYWWKELLFVGVFYLVYSSTGTASGPNASSSARNRSTPSTTRSRHPLGTGAAPVPRAGIQSWFLDWPWFMQFWNTYYGTAHFIVTAAVFIWLYRARPDRFPLWRNVLGATTALAIIGFSLFPLMPPRLLDSHTLYGGARLEGREHRRPYGFVDTLEQFGGPWSFDSGAPRCRTSTPAMPSLHIAWSTWCTLVMWQLTPQALGMAAYWLDTRCMAGPERPRAAVVLEGVDEAERPGVLLDLEPGAAVELLAVEQARRPREEGEPDDGERGRKDGAVAPRGKISGRAR